MPVTPHQSLVKYLPPSLVHFTKDSSAKGKKKGLPPVSDKKASQTEDILNSILPPREWTDDGQLWVQYVSSTPATRMDVIALQELLDQRLQQRQARETGICPIREELYAQCFDELIRQVTINCSERGLLLLRVRDEVRLTIAAYQTLYESSIAFGMRKALMAEQRKADMEQRIRQLQHQCEENEKQVKNLEAKRKAVEENESKKREEEESKHTDQVEHFKNLNMQLKQTLENLLSVPTKK
jgi:dynein light intermediate chain